MTKIAVKPLVDPKEPLRAVKRRGGRKNRGNNQDKAIEVIPKVEWEGVELKEFKKSFVDSNAYTTASRKYNEEALNKYYADNEVRAAGTPVVGQPGPAAPVKLRAPMATLPQTPFPAVLQTELKKQGCDKPTPVQSITWPYILSGQNFVGVGSTGGDKILSYALPLLVHVNDQLVKAKGVKAAPADAKPEDNGPIAVILTHVVKRGDQILAELNKFAPLLNIKTHFIHGVVDEKADDPILLGLNENPHVVIAVCGPKLNDFVLKKKLNLKQCTYLVFDDASKLAKNARSLENVLGQVRPDRQLIMWTTSFGSNGNAQEAIRHAKKHNFDDYIRLFFGSFSHFCNANSVKQIVDPFIPEGERDLRFILTIQTLLTATSLSNKKPHILVFSNTVAKMRKCTDALQKTGLLSKPFQTKNPIPSSTTDAAKKEESKEKPKEDAAATAAAATKMEVAEPAVVVSSEEQKEINDKEMRDNKLYQIWIANDTIPLEELDFSNFDFIVNYDFPSIDKLDLYEQRVAKFQEEAGRGTVYTLLPETSDIKINKYLANYMLESNQYVSARLADDRPQPKKAVVVPAPVANAVKKPTVTTKVMGKPVVNRPPSLLQKNRNGPFNAGNRPFPGNMGGGRNNNFNNGGGRFGGMGGGGPGGARKFNDNFQPFGGGNRGGNFNNRNGGGGGMGMGGGGGGMGAGAGNLGGSGVLDALQLLQSLRNNVNQGGNQNVDAPFYSRRSPKRDDFLDRGNNDFAGGRNLNSSAFNRNDGGDNFRSSGDNFRNSNSMDFTSDNVRSTFNNRNSDFDGGSRGLGSAFNSGNSNPSRNNFSGLNNGSGGGGGGGWFKEDVSSRRFENFSNNWNRNF